MIEFGVGGLMDFVGIGGCIVSVCVWERYYSGVVVLLVVVMVYCYVLVW